MTTPRRLRTIPHGQESVFWWGILMLIFIETTLFTLLIASYFFLKIKAVEWPPEGISKPELLLPTINTGVLILAGVAIAVGDRAIRRDNQLLLKLGHATAIVLAVVFLGIKYYEYSHLPYDWSTHVYGSITWTMAGFHTAHVISVTLKSILVLYMAMIGTYSSDSRLAVEINDMYFYFVVVIWLPVYFTIYLSPYLF